MTGYPGQDQTACHKCARPNPERYSMNGRTYCPDCAASLTTLDPEERAYNMPLARSKRRFAALCDDGRIRRGVCGVPDTFFSIPARLCLLGQTVTGYVTRNRDGVIRFHAYLYRRNHALIRTAAYPICPE